MENENITIYYGVMSDPLEQQLNEFGYTLGEKQDFINKLQHSLNMCHFHLLTESQYQSCLKKFHAKVMKSIEPLDDNQ